MNFKKIVGCCILLFLIFSAKIVFGQAVTPKEAFPNGDTDITIIFDLKLAKDGRAAALLSKNNDVYLWSGAGTTPTGNAFEYQPVGQSDFAKPFVPGTMTALGSDKWSITLNPRKYFNVPAGKTIAKLGLLLKNGDGKAQTEDFILPLFENKLSIAVINPANKYQVIAKNDPLDIIAKFSKKSDVELKAHYIDNDGVSNNISLGQYVQVDSLNEKIDFEKVKNIENGGKISIIITAKTDIDLSIETVIFQVKPAVQIAEQPANIRLGLNYLNETTVVLSFLAPQKNFVYVLGDFNNYESSSEYLMQKAPNSDVFWLEIKNLEKGKFYTYQFLIDGQLQIADPLSEKILDPANDTFLPETLTGLLPKYPAKGKGIVSVLQTNQAGYQWQVGDFTRPKAKDLVVYELLVRDFTTEGTYKAAQTKIPYLKELGINAVELMPIQEFTGNDSWGYNPTFYMAADKAYGTKADLKNFIDECHKNGIAVLLDMVFNQADEAFPYVKMYFDGNQPSANSPFFNPQATHPFSVFRDFNHESAYTKQIVKLVNEYWLKEYKIDGYRFDLSKGFTQKQNTDVSRWSAYDASRVAIWQDYYNHIRSIDASAYVILEHFADVQEETELANLGMLLWGNANGDYRNAIKTGSGNLEAANYLQRKWSQPNIVQYMESHDEERLIFDAVNNGSVGGNYTVKNLPNALERAKALAAAFFITPGPKMIWQFGELGYDVNIDFNGRTGRKPVRWEYFDDEKRKKLYLSYKNLIGLRQLIDAEKYTSYNFSNTGTIKQIELKNSTNSLVYFANLGLETKIYKLSLVKTGIWYDYFSNSNIEIPSSEIELELMPGEFHIYSTNKLANNTVAGLAPWQAYPILKVLTNEIVDENSFVFGPNPFDNTLTISNLNKVLAINIESNMGQTIFTQNTKAALKPLIIDTKTWPAGMYIIKLQMSDGNTQSHKVLKQ